MDEVTAEKAKADRVRAVILVLMALGTVLPFVLYSLFRR
jgi:hypothetical protein